MHAYMCTLVTPISTAHAFLQAHTGIQKVVDVVDEGVVSVAHGQWICRVHMWPRLYNNA